MRDRTSPSLLLVVSALLLGGCGGESRAAALLAGDAAPDAPGSPPAGVKSTSVDACGAAFTVTLRSALVDTQAPGSTLQATVAVRTVGPADPSWTFPLRVSLVQGATEIALLQAIADAPPGSAVDVSWDGLVGGAPAPVGAYALRTSYACSAAPAAVVHDETVAVVRLGTVAVTFADGDGAYQPLLWNALGGVSKNYWSPAASLPVLVRGRGMGAADLEGDGGLRPVPAVWTDLASPPVDPSGDPATVDYDLPFGLFAGTRPDVTLRFGLEAPSPSATAALGDPALGSRLVRARLLESSSPGALVVADGSTATFRLTAPLAPEVGRYEAALHVVFEYEAGTTWTEIEAETLPVRAYGVLGQETISRSDEPPYVPWVAVVDAVAGWAGGAPTSASGLAALVVRHVYDDMGLRYDTVHGASYYTRYADGYGDATFDLSAFLSRDDGSTVNCSDCASIVSTYVDMVGGDLRYNILLSDFPLDYIKAIGTPAFTDDPFHTGAPGSFNYHAITTDPGFLVFDATLHEDGDDDPGASPFEDTEVDGLPKTFYLAHLSPERLTVIDDDKTKIE